MARALNFVASQAVWLLSLLGAGSGWHWLGAVAFALFLALHLWVSRTPRVDAMLALVAAGFGLVLDTGFAQAGVLAYAAPLPLAGIAPYWILVMWGNFGLTLNSSLAWLQQRPLGGALLGAVGGPLAYIAGVKLGAASVTVSPLVANAVIGLSWALALPLLLRLAGRLAGHGR